MCTRAYMSIQKYLQIHIRSADLDLAMGFAEGRISNYVHMPKQELRMMIMPFVRT